MKLVVGLGNPGSSYQNTRHNAGFLVADELQKVKLPKGVVVKKSDVFMNESGPFVKSLHTKYHTPDTDLYIVHDDLDIKLGEYKITLGHGPRDHNGIKSVDRALGTDQYWHVRIGIENRPEEGKPMGIDYVLENFTDEEKKTLTGVIKKVTSDLCKKLAT